MRAQTATAGISHHGHEHIPHERSTQHRDMTAAQSAALDKITEIMREHFDSAVFVFETDANVPEDPKLSDLSYRINGTFCQSLGLLKYAEHRMLSEFENQQ